MQKRNVLNSPRLLVLKKKRQRVFLNKILFFLLVLLAIFAGLAYISRIPKLNISEVEIAGNKVVETDAIKISVQKEITGNYLYFFPKTNIFFYPKNRIRKELGDQFKRLNDINLAIKDYKTLEVKITERVALYTWCGPARNASDIVDAGENTTEKCYFLDKDGYIFDEAPYFSGDVYFKFYGSADIGTYFSENNFKQLIYFKDTLIKMGLNPVSLYIPDNGDIKVFLSEKTISATKPYITLKTDSNFQKVAENLETALSTEPLQTEFKNKYSSLERIDLRFGNKVYYKFK